MDGTVRHTGFKAGRINQMAEDFVKPVTGWYLKNKRDLPWRRTSDPYRIWVSEIMLQQTRVETVIEYYLRFMEALPSVGKLAACEDRMLLKLWEGLGYYRRAGNMKRAAEIIVEEYGGIFPDDPELIRKLPGIGSYTAGAVSSIAFGKPVPAVDGNVLRVWSRIRGCELNILDAKVKNTAEADMRNLLLQNEAEGNPFRAGDINQAFIELGALVCVPGSEPRCDGCPAKLYCRAAMEGLTGVIPVRISKTSRKIEEKTVLIVRDGEKTAVVRRPDHGLLAGLYEFPCVDGYISEKEAVAFVEARGYDALHVRPLGEAVHIFSHKEWHMKGFEIRIGNVPEDSGRWIFASLRELQERWPVATAFSAYAKTIKLYLGKKGKKDSL